MQYFVTILKYCLLCSSAIQITNEIKFIRKIEAVGIPYYKISLRLGSCQRDILMSEYKVWPIARMNRIMDIYYLSEYTISSVEIKLVINDTDCLGYSNTGVGSTEFSGTVFIATNTAVIVYSLKIYTCSENFNTSSLNEEDSVPNFPFLTKFKKTERGNETFI